MEEKISEYLNSYTPISLSEMDSVGFMNRIDTKFHFDVDLIAEILAHCSKLYYVLEINEIRSMPYNTVYFDTPDFKFYLNHINNRYNRFKIRQRTYEVSGDSFFEIKFKNNKSQTNKSRITNNHNLILNENTNDFLFQHTKLHPHNIQKALTNHFHRITLVSKEMDARVTLDYGITFTSDNKTIMLPSLGIAEIKQNSGADKPYVVKLLKELGQRPDGVSKYCIGVSMLYKELKYNSLKEKLLHINKLHNGRLDIDR